MPLVTPEELIVYLDIPAGVAPTDRATRAVNMATGKLQAATGQRLELVTNDVLTLRGGTDRLTLPQRPVGAVGAVTTTEAGVTTARVLNADYYLYGDTLEGAALAAPRVTVTYTHGFAVIPEDLKGWALELAAIVYTNPEGHRRESVDGYDATYGSQSEILKAARARYGRTAASVPLR